MAKAVIQTRVEDDIKQKLEELARSYGLSVSALLRLVIVSLVKGDDSSLISKLILKK